MRIDILTLFPEMFDCVLSASMLGRAQTNGLIDIRIHNIRDYTDNKHRKADDYPFGGGAGLVMLALPISDCMDEVLPLGQTLSVRKTANLHTGGTIHDVTAELHPVLRSVSEQASRALDIPVTGLDLLVPAVDGPDYVIIEANERPGLANHEPQPTAERFVDLLFPNTRVEPVESLS